MAATRQIQRIENPSWLKLPATRGLSRPPTRTQLQLLPFSELEWENFERLCYRLAKTRGDVEQWAALYGARGQKQDGIDIYARRPDEKLYSCWQSKRHRKLTPALLKATIAEFENGAWAVKSEEFVICTSASIQDTKLQREIENSGQAAARQKAQTNGAGADRAVYRTEGQKQARQRFLWSGMGTRFLRRRGQRAVSRTPWMLRISLPCGRSCGNYMQATSVASTQGY